MNKELQNSTKEIYFIIISFSILLLLILSLKIFNYFEMKTIHETTTNIYKHPLQVSNAALNIQKEIYNMHRDIKDIVLSQSKENWKILEQKVANDEKIVYKHISIIEKNILGKDGLKLQKEMLILFNQWKPIRDEVIQLISNNKRIEAINITTGKGANHVSKMEQSANKLYLYAKNKALEFKNQSVSTSEKLTNLVIIVNSVFFILFISIIYYTISRISNYISKNTHLNGVLSVIRNIHKLIIREKSLEKLLQESCNIITTHNLYHNAWIITFDENKKPEYIVGTNNSQNFSLFKDKIKEQWNPNSINNSNDISNDKNIVLIALEYKDNIYGYLNIAIEKKYIIDNKELTLLEEVAGDITYAIHSIQLNKKLEKHEKIVLSLKELYNNIISSIDNLIFVKDTNFTYIACNKAFEKFIGKSQEDIIGKNDFDLFDKEIAQIFRSYDQNMLSHKKTVSNFEWVSYPNGDRVYLLTLKAPLLDSEGKIQGLVGNSADFTTQQQLYNRLKETQTIAKIGSWEYNVQTKKFWLSEESKTIYGITDKGSFFDKDTLKTCIEEKEHVYNSFKNLLEKGFKYDIEFKINPLDGSSKKTISSLGKVEKDKNGIAKKVLGSIQDITDKKYHIKELENKKRELETIINEAPTPIMLHEEDGKIIILNKAWSDISGYTQQEIPTINDWIKNCYDEMIQDDIKKEISSLYSIKQKRKEGTYTFLNKNGDEITWQFSSAPLGIIDGKRRIITAASDITELKKKDKLMIAQSRHAAMGEMIGMIAHQWRQPITTISMSANNILMDIELEMLDEQTTKSQMKVISEQTQELSKTIDDFRNFFKPDKEKLKVKVEDIIHETLTIVTSSLVNNHIQLKISNNSENKVEAYPRELMQVFVNIINNAKDALLCIRQKESLIDIQIYEEDKYITTCICDNGAGIDKKILPKIFDPYFSTKDDKVGTGLGLYMSKMIIEDHLNGKIEICNNKKKGTCFKIKLLKD